MVLLVSNPYLSYFDSSNISCAMTMATKITAQGIVIDHSSHLISINVRNMRKILMRVLNVAPT